VKSVGYQARPSVSVPGRPQFWKTESMSEDQIRVTMTRRRLRMRRTALRSVSRRSSRKLGMVQNTKPADAPQYTAVIPTPLPLGPSLVWIPQQSFCKIIIIQTPFPSRPQSHGIPKPISPSFSALALCNESILHIGLLYIIRIKRRARPARTTGLRCGIIVVFSQVGSVGLLSLDYVVQAFRHFGVDQFEGTSLGRVQSTWGQGQDRMQREQRHKLADLD